ncbi:MAG: DUF2953 domain-containing protein [Methanimicrococcus sp.]|nr:DUF2953 domain-containing protein [Methanimicrococcus sp.]
MTLESALSAAGYYLLLGAGLILLLLFILLAAVVIALVIAFLFARLHSETRVRIAPSSLESRILLFLKIPFYRYDIIDYDDAIDFDDIIGYVGIEKTAHGADSKHKPDKSVCHVILEDEHVRFKTVKSNKHSSEYEIHIHSHEAAYMHMTKTERGEETGEREEANEMKETDEMREADVSDFEYEAADAAEHETSTVEDDGVDFEGVEDADEDDYDFEDDEEDDYDFDFGFAFENISEDISNELKEMKKYVDLSNPSQFASDSISASVKISRAAARFVGALLLRTNFTELSADLIYGLSDPADTALSYGGIHSFKASLYAYFLHVEATSRFSRKRQKAGQMAAVMRDEILVVPDLSQRTAEGKTDIVFSFWLPHLCLPSLRLLLNKNSRWVFRHYVYPYFIRHSFRIWKEERQKEKEEQRKEKEERRKERGEKKRERGEKKREAGEMKREAEEMKKGSEERNREHPSPDPAVSGV